MKTNIIEIITTDIIEKNGACDVMDIVHSLQQFSTFNFTPSEVSTEMRKVPNLVNIDGVYTYQPREIYLPKTDLAEKLHNNIGKNVTVTFGVKAGGDRTVDCKIEKIDSIGHTHVRKSDNQYRQYDNDRLKMVKVGNTTYRLKK